MDSLASVESVLIALDGARPAPEVAEVVGRLTPHDTRWTVLAVTEEHPTITSGATGFAAPVLSPEEMEDRARAARIEADGATAATARALGDRPVHQVSDSGDPVAAVRRQVNDRSFDLVVAGSVDLAEHLTDGGVPLVLAVPSTNGVDLSGPVLVAVDDSPLDEHVIEMTLALLGPSTEILILHVAPTVPPGVGTTAFGIVGVSMPGDPDDILADDILADDAEAAARRWTDMVDARDVTPVGAVGDPARRILDVADDHGAAMIVVGSRDRSWLSTLLRPSVSDAVRRDTERLVLVLR